MSRLFTGALVVSTLSIAGPLSAASPYCFDGAGTSVAGACVFPSRDLDPSVGCATSYTRRDVAMQWFDTTDGCHHGGAGVFGDEDVDDFDLPFQFTYFGRRVQHVGVSDNGWMSFDYCDELDFECYPDSYRLPNPLGPPGAIAVFWKDLDPAGGTGTDPYRYLKMKTFGSAPNRVFVITWEDFAGWGETNSHYTFQVALYETTNVIRFQYLLIDGTHNDSSVGIANVSETVGYDYDRSHALTGKAMEWVPRAGTCFGGTPLTCTTTTQTQSFPMLGTGNNRFYGCAANAHNANEAVFTLDLDRVKLVDIAISSADPGKTLKLFLLGSCSPCQCIDGGDAITDNHIRTVLGPGRYYIVVDGPSSIDSNGNSVNVSTSCEPLLGIPTGTTMSVGNPADPSGCSLKVDYDHFVDGQGFPVVDGWFLRFSDNRSYYAVRVDGQEIYTTAPDVSECPTFNKHSVWVDDNTDSAVSYWQTPQFEVIQTTYGTSMPGSPACCGIRVDTKIRNLDVFPHFYEFRELFHSDFGPSSGTGLCVNEGAVSGGPMRGGGPPADYIDEKNLTCDSFSSPPGICALRCSQPAEYKSADDLQTKLIIQTDPRLPATPDAVRGEWVVYEDIDRICGASPNPWLGGVSAPPDVLAACDQDNGINNIWRIPPGTQSSCAACADCATCNYCLQPYRTSCGEYSFTQFWGKGCRLNTSCSTCLATASIYAPEAEICALNDTFLIADDTPITGCPSATSYQWSVDGVPEAGATSRFYSLNGNDPAVLGSHVYSVVKSCEPPPSGIVCADTREVTVTYYDCAACAITPVITGPSLTCTNQPAVLDTVDSTITSCPGTVSYAWARLDSMGQPVPIPDEEGSTLGVVEAIEGTYQYVVTITCNAPPRGLNCAATVSTPFSLVVSGAGGSGTPLPVPNTLVATKDANDVVLHWEKDPADTATNEFDVLRGLTKESLADQATPPPVVIPRVLGFDARDNGAVGSSDPEYYYRIRGAGCGSLAGEF